MRELRTEELTELYTAAEQAALKAGTYITSQKDTQYEILSKQGGDSLASQVVTEIDIESERIILKELERVTEKYDLAILAEESAETTNRLIKDYFWAIDPLDGTLPFTERRPGYAVSIALVSKSGEPMLGVVYDPVEEVTYSAIKEYGATVRRPGTLFEPLNIEKRHGCPVTIFLDRSFLKHPAYEFCIKRLNEYSLSVYGLEAIIVAQAGAVMNAIGALNNYPSCYFKFPKDTPGGGSIWDYAATASIVSEADGHISDIKGNPLQLNRPHTTFMHEGGLIVSSCDTLTEMVKGLYRERGD